MKSWSERISTLAEVLAPRPALAELPATLSEVYLGLASADQYMVYIFFKEVRQKVAIYDVMTVGFRPSSTNQLLII